MFGKFQDLLKGCLFKLQNHNNPNKSAHIKHVSTKEFHHGRIEQLNVLENEFKEKADRIKVY